MSGPSLPMKTVRQKKIKGYAEQTEKDQKYSQK